MRIPVVVATGYLLVAALAGWFVFEVFIEEIKPGVRDAQEEILVDGANLLAELVAPELAAGSLDQGRFAAALERYRRREVAAEIWEIPKHSLDYRVYVTDAAGRVLASTDPQEVGRDYSRWRDVHLTLRGRYGARSTRDDPGDERSSVMHVAAPVMDQGRIIGVVTVAKPGLGVQPYIDRGQRRLRDQGLLLVLVAGLIGALFTWHLTRGIERLRRYARDVAEGHRRPPPRSDTFELAELGAALHRMRERLEGKQYVERYVHSLTHELKSPLAAIRGAAELLAEPDLPPAERDRFLGHIREQEERLRQVADRLLELARVEQLQVLHEARPLDLAELAREVAEALAPQAQARARELKLEGEATLSGHGDPFLLRQALANLVDNALAFSAEEGEVAIRLAQAGERLTVEVCDRGPGVPDYARDQIFERFFSLPRPDSGRKSSGLGLPFVREVAQLHGGEITLRERPGGGTCARLELPAHPRTPTRAPR